MGELVLVSEVLVPGSPSAIFDRFGRPSGAGWLFDSSCDCVVPGQVVRFAMPSPDGARILATGRIAEVEQDRRIVVLQESPWRGRVVITFDPRGADETAVRLRVGLADDCFPWILRATGKEVAEPEDPVRMVRIGVLLSLSGVAGMLGRAAQNAAELAVEEINAEGGIRGLPVRAHVRDDATDPATAAREFVRLADHVRCDAVVAMVTSASMAAVRPLAEKRGTLLLYAPTNEGGPPSRRIFHFGERPSDQLVHSIPRLMKETGGRGWFLIGNSYSWPRAVGRAARRVIESSGGTVLDERYLPLGAEDFGDVLEAIEASGADHLVSAMVGADAVAFERSFFAAGLRSKTRTIATLMDDVVREHIGDQAAAGIWSVLDHFMELDTPESRDLAQRWRNRYGLLSPPLSATAKSVYDVTRLYAECCRWARSICPDDVARALRTPRRSQSRLLARAAGVTYPTTIAEAVPGGFVFRHVAD